MKAIIPLISLAFILTSCKGSSPDEKTVTNKTGQKDTVEVKSKSVEGQNRSLEERNKKVARDFYAQVINQHNPDLVDSFLSPDYVEHYEDRHYVENRKGLKNALEDFFEAFPDLAIRINFVTAEKELVTVQFTMTGTNTGSMFKHKPSNNKISVEGVDVIRYESGKAVEHWGYIEETKFLRQLRIKPSEVDAATQTTASRR